MPVCFQLIDKGTGRPAILAEVDNRLCELFGAQPHPVKYFKSWYDVVGLRLAVGRTFPDIREEFISFLKNETLEEKNSDCEYIAIISYLELYYDTKAWRE